MASDKTVTDPFLAAIEAKIAAWTAVRESYCAAVALDSPIGEGGTVVNAAPGSGKTAIAVRRASHLDLPVGVFRDKSLKEAIRIYLESKQQKQTNKQIAKGLQDGGFPTTADNFEPTVATALYRLKNEGILLRFPDGWDLASSYPDSLRNRLEKGEQPPKRLRAKRVKRSASADLLRVPRLRKSKTTPLLSENAAEE